MSNLNCSKFLQVIVFLIVVSAGISVAKEKAKFKPVRQPSQERTGDVYKEYLRAEFVEAQSMEFPKLTVLKSFNNEITVFLKYRATEGAVDFNCLPMDDLRWGCANDCQMGSIVVEFPKRDFTEAVLDPYELRIQSCDPNKDSSTFTTGRKAKTRLKRVRPW